MMSDHLPESESATTSSSDVVVVPLECAVCLQQALYPVKLPCRHVFCFLCIKGVASRSQKCPLCRAEIPYDYFDEPVIVDVSDTKETPVSTDTRTEFFWYYEGRQGWWQYDERTASDIEKAFQDGAPTVEVLIAGHFYVVNFECMTQWQKEYTNRRRRVKRDRREAAKKGVAGLKIVPSAESVQQAEEVPSTCERKADDVTYDTDTADLEHMVQVLRLDNTDGENVQ